MLFFIHLTVCQKVKVITMFFYQLLQLTQILATQIHVDLTVNAGQRALGQSAPVSRDISEDHPTVDPSVC